MLSRDKIKGLMQAGMAEVIAHHTLLYPVGATSVCTCGEEISTVLMRDFHNHVAEKVMEYLLTNSIGFMHMVLETLEGGGEDSAVNKRTGPEQG